MGSSAGATLRESFGSTIMGRVFTLSFATNRSSIEIETLRAYDVLEPFDDEQLRAVLSLAEEENFAAGTVLYDEGAPGEDVFLILCGRVEARRTTPFGVQVVASLGPGDLVGEISLLDGRPRSAAVVGVVAGRLLRLPAMSLASLTAGHPELELLLLGEFCRTLAGKIRQANLVMTEIMAPGVRGGSSRLSAAGKNQTVNQSEARELLAAHGLGDDDLRRLTEFLGAESFDSGETIVSEGAEGDALFLVAEGRVRISRGIPGLGEETIAILDRGEVFGEMAWIDSKPRSADAVAHTGGCTVFRIRRSDLDRALAVAPETGVQFLKLVCQILCRRLRQMTDQLVAYRTIAWF